MGLDINYVYGYCLELENIEFDLDYLKEKFKDNLNFKFKDLPISKVISLIEKNNEDFDYDLIIDKAKNLNLRTEYVFEEWYVFFNHFDICKDYPYVKVSELDKYALHYLDTRGVKNPEKFTWEEFGGYS